MITKDDKIKILELFKKYNLDWFLNISSISSKSLEYQCLHDEISLESSQDLKTKLTIIKNNKKSNFNIDWYSLEKIQKAMEDIIWIINYWEFDKDIIIPNITDVVEKDFSNKNLDIDFKQMQEQFEKVAHFPFDKQITLDSFSIWYSEFTHYFINSLWSFKSQKDNYFEYYFSLLWENQKNSDEVFFGKSTKIDTKIEQKDLEESQKLLLDKISDFQDWIEKWTYNITLDKDLVIEFLSIVLENMWAESIREKMSLFWENKLWDKVFWENFTIINNPESDYYTWNIVFDKEWITAKKTILFEKWVLKSKFCDYKNVLKEWDEFLWNSTISNIELVWEWDENFLKNSQIYFTNLMSFHSVDWITWKFSLNWEWYLIENWQKTKYLKNISLCSDLKNLFSNILAFWTDFKKDWNFKVPSITFSNQKVV